MDPKILSLREREWIFDEGLRWDYTWCEICFVQAVSLAYLTKI